MLVGPQPPHGDRFRRWSTQASTARAAGAWPRPGPQTPARPEGKARASYQPRGPRNARVSRIDHFAAPRPLPVPRHCLRRHPALMSSATAAPHTGDRAVAQAADRYGVSEGALRSRLRRVTPPAAHRRRGGVPDRPGTGGRFPRADPGDRPAVPARADLPAAQQGGLATDDLPRLQRQVVNNTCGTARRTTCQRQPPGLDLDGDARRSTTPKSMSSKTCTNGWPRTTRRSTST